MCLDKRLQLMNSPATQISRFSSTLAQKTKHLQPQHLCSFDD
jgi:hypothetical protein